MEMNHPPQLRWYKNWRILVPLVLLLVILYMYLLPGLRIAYTYFWWTCRSEGVFQWAAPEQVSQNSQPLVPKLLHQTWKDDQLPNQWKEARQSCMDLHPGYEYKLWTDKDAEQLIATKFPWFLTTFKSYPYGIQRADALRYFVLYEYGGIYLDMDVVCNKNLDYLRHFEFVTPKTYPIAISNDIMMAKPHSDFALRLIQQLKTWNVFLFVKYATVMFSTGPMFVSAQYALHEHKERLSVLPVELYGKYKLTGDALFKHLHGSTWHGSDGKYILWIDHNAVLFASMVMLLLASAATGLFVSCRHKAIARRGNGVAHGHVAGGLAPGGVEDAVRGTLHKLASISSAVLGRNGFSHAGGGARKGNGRVMVPP